MTRLNKYKAWNPDTKEMLEYVPIEAVTCGKHLEMLGTSLVLLQCTGLRDRNGVDIAQGDIVFDEDGEYSKTIVITPEENFVGFFGKSIEDNDVFTLDEIGDDCLVIGNIYENPELLQ